MPIGASPVPRNSAQRQPERDQQDVVDSGVKRRRHLTEQLPGGLDIQRHRQMSGAGIGIHCGLHRGQRAGVRRDLPPGLGLVDDGGVVCVFGQQ